MVGTLRTVGKDQDLRMYYPRFWVSIPSYLSACGTDGATHTETARAGSATDSGAASGAAGTAQDGAASGEADTTVNAAAGAEVRQGGRGIGGRRGRRGGRGGCRALHTRRRGEMAGQTAAPQAPWSGDGRAAQIMQRTVQAAQARKVKHTAMRAAEAQDARISWMRAERIRRASELRDWMDLQLDRSWMLFWTRVRKLRMQPQSPPEIAAVTATQGAKKRKQRENAMPAATTRSVIKKRTHRPARISDDDSDGNGAGGDADISDSHTDTESTSDGDIDIGSHVPVVPRPSLRPHLQRGCTIQANTDKQHNMQDDGHDDAEIQIESSQGQQAASISPSDVLAYIGLHKKRLQTPYMHQRASAVDGMTVAQALQTSYTTPKGDTKPYVQKVRPVDPLVPHSPYDCSEVLRCRMWSTTSKPAILRQSQVYMHMYCILTCASHTALSMYKPTSVD